MFLALREMRRAKTRFGLLTGAVALLVFLILFQQSLLGSLITQFIGALRHQSAPVLVYGEQARKNLEGSQVTEAQVARVRAAAGVGAVGVIGEGTFTVTAKGELRDAVIFGYELGGLGAPTTLIEGRLPERDGEAVASDHQGAKGFGLGATVRVEPGGSTITVVGVAKDASYSVAPTLFVSYPTYVAARKVRNPDAVAVLPSALGVRPAAGTSAADVVASIERSVPGVEALTRSAAVKGSPGVSQVSSSFTIVLALFYLVVPFVTGLFFLIVTFQKAGALTLLRAVGAPAGLLVRSLVVQVAAVMVAGVAVAVALQGLAAQGMRNAAVSVELSVPAVLVTGGVLLALALLAALGAIRRVLRIEPIAATTGAGVGR